MITINSDKSLSSYTFPRSNMNILEEKFEDIKGESNQKPQG